MVNRNSSRSTGEACLAPVAIKIMGCRLNHAEAGAIRGALEAHGCTVLEHSEPHATLVIHSCAITAAAQTEALRIARSAKRRGVSCVIMSGCTASIENTQTLFDNGIDAVVDKLTGACSVRAASGIAPDSATRAPIQSDIANIAQIVSDALSNQTQSGTAAALPRFSSTRASVKVQDGCNFRCAYCIVPDARGAPHSRDFDDILREIQGLAATGFREIVLTGVNVACWTQRDLRLVDLVRAASQLPGVARIRLSSVEPGTTERALIDLMGEADVLCHTLHYPLQSGDAGILRAMRRRYTPEQYAAAVEYALAKIPLLGLGADIITGFPGETDAAFANTVALVERYPFSNLHVFPYSERPGTPAAAMPDKVPVRVRRDRARRLIEIGDQKRAAFAARFVGRDVAVLVERVDPDGTGHGWTSEYVAAKIAGLQSGTAAPADVGRLVTAHATASGADGVLHCVSAR